MRINDTFTILNETLSTAIRRQYPLVYTEDLTNSFDNLTLPENLENSLARIPYIEALPQYKNNPRATYGSGLQALLDPEILGEPYRDFIEFMQKWKPSGAFFDPYVHQVQALRAWAKGSDIIVSTGTGSGKTECFLWPIIGHLHRYARRNKDNPGAHRGIKALILYPMNALVADQLKRLRRLLGGEELANDLAQGALIQGGHERTFQFGQYTGRTKFHGSYAQAGTRGGSVNGKVSKAANQFANFNKIRTHESTRPELERALYSQMMEKGLIPAKGNDDYGANDSLFWDMESFSSHQGAPDKENAKLITEPGDRELFFRHEMHNTGYANLTMKQGGVDVPRITDETNGGGTPDVLVTNYSMLEYMLKRPLEHGMFHETKEWLAEHPENKLMLVLDEAHLYQGALGSEVGLLVRRLLSSLGVLGPELHAKVQFILTSASLGDDPGSKEHFVHGLTGRPLEDTGCWSYKDSSDVDWNSDLSTTSVYIKGEKWIPEEGDCADEDLQEIREELRTLNYQGRSNEYLLDHFLGKTDTPDTQFELTEWMRGHPLFRRLYMSLLDVALSLDEVGQRIFGTEASASAEEKQQTRLATEAVLNLVAALKGPRPDSERALPLLGIRAHLLYRGLPRLYWDLGRSQILLREQNSLDVAYPVRGCRQCGAPYASMWISQEKWATVRETIRHGGACTARTFSRPIDHSIRLEVYLYDDFIIEHERGIGIMEIGEREIRADGPAHIWVNTEDSQIKVNGTPPGGNWRAGYLAAERRHSPTDPVLLIQDAIRNSDDETGRSNVQEITFCKATCLQCNTLHKRRQSDQITDYMTRGDDAFSQLMKELISHQSEDPEKTHLPNKGKKVMVFSDSRSRAAKLAKKIQDNSNYDELRLLLLHLLKQPWYRALPIRIKTLDHLYSTFVLNCVRAKLEPFSGTGDKFRNSRDSFARTRVDLIAAHAALLLDKIDEPFFDNRPELKEIIEAANGEVPHEDKAVSFFDDFCARAPRSNEEFVSQADRYGRKSHGAYVGMIRRALMSAVTRGVQNQITEMAFTSKEKRIILGVCFDPEFHNDQGDIDVLTSQYDEMRTRLAGMGITFADTSIEKNSIVRFRAIMCDLNAEIEGMKPTNSELDRWVQLVADIRRLCLARIQKIRDFQHNNKATFFQNCRIRINSGIYALDELSGVVEQVIEADAELLSGSARRIHWQQVSELANLANATPWDFSSAILDFIGSKDFSLSSLGLGYASLSPVAKSQLRTAFIEDADEEEESTIEFNDHWSTCLNTVLSELVHWMTRPSFGPDSDGGKEKAGGQRCIVSDGAYNYHSMKHHPSVYTKQEEWGIFPNYVERKYESLIGAMGADILVPFTDIRNSLFQQNSHQDAGNKLLVKSSVIELVHLLDEDANLLGCRRCGIAMPILHVDTAPNTCINCGYVDLIEYDPEISIFKQRIESPWRTPARRAINSSYENLAITVIRAEEHTAQINTAKDDEEMYTSAEEFELLFQDVPFTVPEEDDAWTFVQSPVDILSCTTTMEVGIDIGSLTCVALRTIPRKASNYQQRVGRAGRGSAEVCVAVSWCDNQPHAQNYFDNPREMLTHPRESPVIYLNNKAIIKRHINAAIFQAFFKRMIYNLPQRRFNGMGAPEHEANLMESMGTLESFFSDATDNGFSHLQFCDWLNGENPSEDENPDMAWVIVRPQIEAILPEQLADTLEDFVNDLREFLLNIQNTIDQNEGATE
jgi:Lhr-like helicase